MAEETGWHYDPDTKLPVRGGRSVPEWWQNLPDEVEREQVRSETAPLGGPVWWTLRARAHLDPEQESMAECETWWRGPTPLPDVVNHQTAAKYAEIVEESRLNYLRTTIEVLSERLAVQGLWIPGDDERLDSETWDIWLRNDLDAWQESLFASVLAKRRSFLSVWWDVPGSVNPKARIEIEDATEVYVENMPGSRTERLAAVKVYVDEWTGDLMATVTTLTEITDLVLGKHGWEVTGESVPNPLGAVPFVPLVNRPEPKNPLSGYSEIADLIPTQKRILRTILGRGLAGHTAAHLQKWATGIEVAEDENGNAIAPFTPGVTELWVSEEENAKFGQFDATDPSNYLKSEEADLEHIVNVTRIPRHLFRPEGQEPSGDSMKAMSHGLDRKIESIQRHLAGGIRSTLELARRIENVETPMASEVVWADTSFQTFAQLVDGLVKLHQDGIVSAAYVRERIGLSPNAARRIETELEEESLAALTEILQADAGAGA